MGKFKEIDTEMRENEFVAGFQFATRAFNHGLDKQEVLNAALDTTIDPDFQDGIRTAVANRDYMIREERVQKKKKQSFWKGLKGLFRAQG